MTVMLAARGRSKKCKTGGKTKERCVYFRIGFRIVPGSNYNGWPEKQRQKAKAKVREKIIQSCGKTTLNGWNGFPIWKQLQDRTDKEDWEKYGHLAEKWNRHFSQECLDQIKGKHHRIWDSTKDKNKTSMPTSSIVYVYVNERQICVHDYLLVKETKTGSEKYKQWTIKAGPKGREATFAMYGSFQWPTYMPVP